MVADQDFLKGHNHYHKDYPVTEYPVQFYFMRPGWNWPDRNPIVQ